MPYYTIKDTIGPLENPHWHSS